MTQLKLSPYLEQQRLEDRFQVFHADHPDVYDELVNLAYDALVAGHQRYSIATLVEVVRWNRHTSGPDAAGFKINNSYRSRYARLIMEREPALDGFFETRTLTT